MITVGPYTFSDTDADRTVGSHAVVWSLLTEGRDPAVVEHLAPVLTGDVAHDLPLVWDAWAAAGHAYRAAGALPQRVDGTVAALHRSDGGIPKTAVESVEVGWRGVVGDRQASRTHHGRPWQALCLWSTEVIDGFRSDGHPLAPGLAGENITVTGLPWPEVRPGVHIRVGGVLCCISSYAIPCKQNTGWFIDGQFMLMHHDRGPVSRVYATVVEPGHIRVGDPAVLEP